MVGLHSIHVLDLLLMMPFAGVKVLSEVGKRLTMMFGAGASTYRSKCGGAAFSRLTEVATTAVPAGTSPAPRRGPRFFEPSWIKQRPWPDPIRKLFHRPRCNEGRWRFSAQSQPSPFSCQSA